MSQPLDVVQSHPDRSSRRRPEPGPRTRLALRLLGVVAAVALIGSVVWNGVRDDPVPRCGVQGHRQWCRTPSRQMTGPAVATVVRAYCPGLTDTPGGRLALQPLRRLHLADGPTYAIESGRPGTEDALFGRARAFAQVTLWRGGRYDGRVDVRCPRADATVPVLEMTRDQLASTVSALGDVTHRSIDFAGLADSAVRRTNPNRSIVLGTFSCDTRRVELRSLHVGARFGCRVEIFRLLGKGIYPLTYAVTRASPYARLLGPRG